MTRNIFSIQLALFVILSLTDRALASQQPDQKPKTVLLDITEIAERVNDVVVNVRSNSEGGESLGSGFIIDKRGLIVTNFHLISNTPPRRPSAQPETSSSTKLATNVSVTLNDGRQFPASVKGYDEATDLALLEIVITAVGIGPRIIIVDLIVFSSSEIGIAGILRDQIVQSADAEYTRHPEISFQARIIDGFEVEGLRVVVALQLGIVT